MITPDERTQNAAAKAEQYAAIAEIRRDDDGEWLVLSSQGTEVYHTTIETCTCKAGEFGQPCWHRLAVKNLIAGELAAAIAPKATVACQMCGKQYHHTKLTAGRCAHCELFGE